MPILAQSHEAFRLEERIPVVLFLVLCERHKVDEVEISSPMRVAELRPNEIRDYVKSLKTSSAHWFCTFYPELKSPSAKVGGPMRFAGEALG